MTPILDRIRAQGGNVIRKGFTFSLRQGRLTPDAVAWVKANLEAVKAEVWPAYDDWQERAAIMEFEADMPRDAAEQAAYECVEAQRAAAA